MNKEQVRQRTPSPGLESHVGRVTMARLFLRSELTALMNDHLSTYQFLGVLVLVLVSLTLLFSLINTHKSGAHLILGLIITGFALCLGHLVRNTHTGHHDTMGDPLTLDILL